ncbi:MAG TPA: hypothetical protein VJ623_06025 [Holophagaceae bacterium]|nr:hypothetical protein [Holophagaceae bacterium]
MRAAFVSILLSLASLSGGVPTTLPTSGPFKAPEEMKDYVLKVTRIHQGMKAKAGALLRMTFAPEAEGGLGIQYDNSQTRSVEEVWRDRKANCLGLTAFFVSSCRVMGLEAGFAEAPSISQWRKDGPFIRHEKHMVAVLDNKPIGVLVMDFSPEFHKGFYQVIPLTEDKALAMFHSNRAVESLGAGRTEEAFLEAQAGVAASPAVGIAWNVLGVVLRDRQDPLGAERAFRKSLEVDPLEGAACGNLETLCVSQGRHAEAAAYRSLAANLRAKDPYFHAFLAKEALDQGDLKVARRELDAALKLYHREPEFYVLMAQLNLYDGESRDAERALQLAKKWASPEEQARMDLKLAKIRAGGN